MQYRCGIWMFRKCQPTQMEIKPRWMTHVLMHACCSSLHVILWIMLHPLFFSSSFGNIHNLCLFNSEEERLNNSHWKRIYMYTQIIRYLCSGCIKLEWWHTRMRHRGKSSKTQKDESASILLHVWRSSLVCTQTSQYINRSH